MPTAIINPVLRLWHILASVPGALAGPILTKELRVSSRRRRNYVLRGTYLAVLTVFIVLVWLANVRWDTAGDYAFRVSRMAEAGKIIIACISWFQFIALQMVAVIMLSTSISEEVYSKTLGVLMTTPINSFQIVIGKLFSKIFQLLILVAASLPLLAVMRVLGGVPWDYVVASLCVTLTSILVVASVTMFFSILFRWAFVSILMSLLTLGVIYGLVPFVIVLFISATEAWRDNSLMEALASIFINHNSYATMTFLTVTALEPRARAVTGTIFFAWWVNCLVSLGFAAVVLAVCVAMVRKVGRRLVAGATGAGPSDASAIAASAAPVLTPAPQPGQAAAGTLPPARPAKPAKVRPIKGSPILWRELRSTWIKRGVLYWVLLGVGAWLLLLIYGLVAWAGHDPFGDNDVHMGFLIVYTILGALVTAILAATNITSEKESRSWELLLCTPLGDWHILLAKFAGALRRCLPIWMLPIAHILLFTLAGYCQLALLPMYLLIAGGVVVLLVGAGLYFGSRFRRTTTAVILNIALGLGLWAALPGATALLSEAMPLKGSRDDLRHATGYIVDANPVFQTGVVCSRLSGDRGRRYYQSANFHWEGLGSAGFAESLAYLILLASMNVALGMLLAWRAKCQFRKRWF